MISLLLAASFWAEPAGVPWTLQARQETQQGFLEADAPARMETDTDGPYLAIAVPLGQHLALKLGAETPVPLQPLHMYRVAAHLRCPARLRVWLRTDEQAVGMEQELSQILPAIDFQVAPIWEVISGFLIVPDGPSGRSFILDISNAANGRDDWSIGLRDLRFDDLGLVQPLDPPQVIARWPRVELNEPLTVIPRVVHDGGSGLYRVQATVETSEACSLRIILDQGDEERHHWWRSTGLSHTIELPAGITQLSQVFHVADRRFLHQWLRFTQPVTTPTTILRDVELIQISKEPLAAAEAGLQSPSRR